jgi:hypothetical protein
MKPTYEELVELLKEAADCFCDDWNISYPGNKKFFDKMVDAIARAKGDDP